MSLKFFLTILAIVITLSACMASKEPGASSSGQSVSSSSSSSSSGQSANNSKTGAELYKEQCVICHGEDGLMTRVSNIGLNVDKLSEQELYAEILLTMPEKNADLCTQECAKKVTDYITTVLFPEIYRSTGSKVGHSALRLLPKSQFANIVKEAFNDLQIDTNTLLDKLPDPVFDEHSGFKNNAGAVASETFYADLLNASQTLAESISEKFNQKCANPETDNNCSANSFINRYAEKLYRKTISNTDKSSLESLYQQGRNHNEGIALVAQALIVSPETVYSLETNNENTARELTGMELANRLALFLWNSPPDSELLSVIDNLQENETLRLQATRMLENQKASSGLASFFSQWLHIDDMSAKDAMNFSKPQADAAATALTRFFDFLIRKEDAAFADLYMNRSAFVSDDIANIYRQAIPANAEVYMEGKRIDLPSNERAGILTRAGYIAAHSGEVFTSPTKRGVVLRERILCQHIPLPTNADDANINEAAGLRGKEFAAVHSKPGSACEACHRYLDNIGLNFEFYNSIGAYSQTYEDGEVIDPSGKYISLSSKDLDQEREVADAVDLSKLISESQVAAECLASNWMRYALSRNLDDDLVSFEFVMNRFEDSGYKLRDLILAIIESRAFRYQGADTVEIN